MASADCFLPDFLCVPLPSATALHRAASNPTPAASDLWLHSPQPTSPAAATHASPVHDVMNDDWQDLTCCQICIRYPCVCLVDLVLDSPYAGSGAHQRRSCDQPPPPQWGHFPSDDRHPAPAANEAEATDFSDGANELHVAAANESGAADSGAEFTRHAIDENHTMSPAVAVEHRQLAFAARLGLQYVKSPPDSAAEPSIPKDLKSPRKHIYHGPKVAQLKFTIWVDGSPFSPTVTLPAIAQTSCTKSRGELYLRESGVVSSLPIALPGGGGWCEVEWQEASRSDKSAFVQAIKSSKRSLVYPNKDDDPLYYDVRCFVTRPSVAFGPDPGPPLMRCSVPSISIVEKGGRPVAQVKSFFFADLSSPASLEPPEQAPAAAAAASSTPDPPPQQPTQPSAQTTSTNKRMRDESMAAGAAAESSSPAPPAMRPAVVAAPSSVSDSSFDTFLKAAVSRFHLPDLGLLRLDADAGPLARRFVQSVDQIFCEKMRPLSPYLDREACDFPVDDDFLHQVGQHLNLSLVHISDVWRWCKLLQGDRSADHVPPSGRLTLEQLYRFFLWHDSWWRDPPAITTETPLHFLLPNRDAIYKLQPAHHPDPTRLFITRDHASELLLQAAHGDQPVRREDLYLFRCSEGNPNRVVVTDQVVSEQAPVPGEVVLSAHASALDEPTGGSPLCDCIAELLVLKKCVASSGYYFAVDLRGKQTIWPSLDNLRTACDDVLRALVTPDLLRQQHTCGLAGPSSASATEPEPDTDMLADRTAAMAAAATPAAAATSTTSPPPPKPKKYVRPGQKAR